MVADITSFITEKLIAYRIVLPIVFIEHVKKEEKKNGSMLLIHLNNLKQESKD